MHKYLSHAHARFVLFGHISKQVILHKLNSVHFAIVLTEEQQLLYTDCNMAEIFPVMLLHVCCCRHGGECDGGGECTDPHVDRPGGGADLQRAHGQCDSGWSLTHVLQTHLSTDNPHRLRQVLFCHHQLP